MVRGPWQTIQPASKAWKVWKTWGWKQSEKAATRVASEGISWSGSCRASGGLSDPQEGSEKSQRRPLDVVGPLEQGHILVQVLLAHAPERPQEVPQPRPQPLQRVAI